MGVDRWIWTDWSGLTRDALYDLVRLRQAVFVVEQACAYPDLDGRDPEAHHLLGYDADGLVAYLRVFGPGVVGPDPVIGRVIVAPRARGTGLGHVLMDEGRRRLWALHGEGPVWIGAQARLERFYGALGYRVCGPGYDEDGIPHLPMRLVPGV
ncbi:MAG: GNAT family N-acetyltransferase [Alphaproteobacteria bacterium]|nr:GNAT family N-acetyltransferase [Alphaproteobacteria bacterium]